MLWQNIGVTNKRGKKSLKTVRQGKKSVIIKTIKNQFGFRRFYWHENYLEQERVWSQVVVTQDYYIRQDSPSFVKAIIFSEVQFWKIFSPCTL